ncbi:Dam family site-specific DNA-(adenine-N6)-methyltransferase [Candidatus Enterovibrio escicola]|uniref:Site-specific DNA-methyltransferase (adenine-specific) n=1 Tax=Candidatus Enterovibrio escicola TaxID=1927127 RepID=A0A2A5T229_9GAMM|nr:Dam family site-specific DNA-(adenine-N6)-methyltransferase [Candidatus Enterovibrio escacola]PCS22204.1 Methyl-directed repair DNA adenine methylase [Candidatus Enterovibrio escacola]
MKKHRAFLKWAGGKYSLVEDIRHHLPEGKKLIEPFVGAGSVFLNTDYEQYRLSDINPDLTNLYNLVKQSPERYIDDARKLFQPKYNQKVAYLAIREEFNASKDPYLRALYFLYMNRHGFNGLCRYNKKGSFNVPFGTYKKPYFPQAEIEFFSEKAKKATFICEGYQQSFTHASLGSVIYCDPPYAPLSGTANFTTYSAKGFSLYDQALLGKIAAKTVTQRNIPVLISNHDTPLIRHLYAGAYINVVQVKRTISRNGEGRNKVDELLALFICKKSTLRQRQCSL